MAEKGAVSQPKPPLTAPKNAPIVRGGASPDASKFGMNPGSASKGKSGK